MTLLLAATLAASPAMPVMAADPSADVQQSDSAASSDSGTQPEETDNSQDPEENGQDAANTDGTSDGQQEAENNASSKTADSGKKSSSGDSKQTGSQKEKTKKTKSSTSKKHSSKKKKHSKKKSAKHKNKKKTHTAKKRTAAMPAERQVMGMTAQPADTQTQEDGQKNIVPELPASTSKIDASTTLPDGTYRPKEFSAVGGTGKVIITCPQITVRDGKAYATIQFSSPYYTKLATDGKTFKAKVNQTARISRFENVPVDLNSTQTIIGTTTAMSQPHDISYRMQISLAEPASDDQTKEVDNRFSDLKDGAYIPDSFRFSGGTGKVKITCPKIEVVNGKTYATIVYGSPYYTQLRASGRLYQATVDKKARTSIFRIPIQVGKDNKIIGTTTAMSQPHDIPYTIHAVLTKSSKKYAEKSQTKQNENKNKNSGRKNHTSSDNRKKEKLSAGTYRVRSDTDNRMFYIVPDSSGVRYSVLKVSKNGKMTAEVTLTGQGYDYLYMGNMKQASRAKKSSLSRYKEKNGYYTYTLPISALDKNLVISSHSKRLNRWYQHTIIFYSGGAKKVKGTVSVVPSKRNHVTKRSEGNATSGRQTHFKNDKKADKVSKWKDDSSKSTSSVNSNTGLKDGVYTPDAFSWSGGSGRLAYIRCNKITVKGGQAYATIEFGSTFYDSLRANGRTYSRSGGGNSKFVIPVKLNANNTIIGRTTAMSQPHWITYKIYIAKDGSGSNKGADAGAPTKKLSKKAPKILGLKAKKQQKSEKVSHAKYFKIYDYNDGIKLISVDVTKDTARDPEVLKAEKKKAEKNQKNRKKDTKKSAKTTVKKKTAAAQTQQTESGYDEQGRPLAKTAHEITSELYQNNVINYLVVPEGKELPAGLEKKYIIIRTPAKHSYIAANKAYYYMKQLDALGNVKTSGITKEYTKVKTIKKKIGKKVKYAGGINNLNYRMLIHKKTDMAVLSGGVLPRQMKGKLTKKEQQAFKAANAKKMQKLKSQETGMTTLDIPVLIDRSNHEDKLGNAEWIKVYGTIYGCEKQADAIYNQYVKEQKSEKK